MAPREYRELSQSQRVLPDTDSDVIHKLSGIQGSHMNIGNHHRARGVLPDTGSDTVGFRASRENMEQAHRNC